MGPKKKKKGLEDRAHRYTAAALSVTPSSGQGKMREGHGRKEDEVVHVSRGGRVVYVVQGGVDQKRRACAIPKVDTPFPIQMR